MGTQNTMGTWGGRGDAGTLLPCALKAPCSWRKTCAGARVCSRLRYPPPSCSSGSSVSLFHTVTTIWGQQETPGHGWPWSSPKLPLFPHSFSRPPMPAPSGFRGPGEGGAELAPAPHPMPRCCPQGPHIVTKAPDSTLPSMDPERGTRGRSLCQFCGSTLSPRPWPWWLHIVPKVPSCFRGLHAVPKIPMLSLRSPPILEVLTLSPRSPPVPSSASPWP